MLSIQQVLGGWRYPIVPRQLPVKVSASIRKTTHHIIGEVLTDAWLSREEKHVNPTWSRDIADKHMKYSYIIPYIDFHVKPLGCRQLDAMQFLAF